MTSANVGECWVVSQKDRKFFILEQEKLLTKKYVLCGIFRALKDCYHVICSSAFHEQRQTKDHTCWVSWAVIVPVCIFYQVLRMTLEKYLVASYFSTTSN